MSGAWDEYWRGASGQPSGCLPESLRSVDAEQARLWRGFAASLPRGARVVDLATGDGTVLRRLGGARRDLSLTGFDSARALPAPPRGVRLKPSVAMERLPLRDASVGAVTSQFGFEYGEIRVAAAEIARVLRPGGRVALLTHRGDSPILEHNRTRRAGLRWVLDERRLVERARAALPMLVLGGSPPADLLAAPAEAARRFGAASAGWELAEAVCRSVRSGAPGGGAAALEELDRLARNEVGRIDSLEGACRTAGDGGPIAEALVLAGLSHVTQSDAREHGTGANFGHWTQARQA